ncbi:hypothetical protein LGR48_18850 [Acinetobacter baumannii]|uniref:hypothetical protein n=1 Tax=Acinetobacter baumannii TaxID=470 RepID=UPI001CF447D1|nr:hypothetical protein [Acinetobacter baumannii]MCB2285360.1 hypothetical protein [Acinetobacter baumannii]
MIVITVGKNALLGIKDKDKYLENFRSAFKAEYDYPIMYTNDEKLLGIKVGFRFTDRGIPLNKVDKVLNRINSAFNVQ